MWHDVQLYIAFYSPSISLRLFGEVVLPGGEDNYEISKMTALMCCVPDTSQSGKRRAYENKSGMELRTCVSCSVMRPGEVDVTEMIDRMIDHIYCEITHDFLLLENREDIIVMRKDGVALVNTNVSRSFGSEVCDRQYEICDLPKFNLKEENSNGNGMDNRN